MQYYNIFIIEQLFIIIIYHLFCNTMEYRILLFINGTFKKTLHVCKRLKTSKDNFKRILEENKKILFPQQYITSYGLEEAEYTIYKVKKWEDKDDEKTVRDKLGRIIKNKPLLEKWCVLDSNSFNVEEKFYVYGYDAFNDRKDINFILTLLLKDMGHQNLTKDIIFLHNKLFIYNEYQFDIVICKCPEDCERLYYLLREISLRNKFKRLLFMGYASEKMTGDLYEMMMDHTGWDYRRVTRISTKT